MGNFHDCSANIILGPGNFGGMKGTTHCEAAAWEKGSQVEGWDLLNKSTTFLHFTFRNHRTTVNKSVGGEG